MTNKEVSLHDVSPKSKGYDRWDKERKRRFPNAQHSAYTSEQCFDGSEGFRKVADWAVNYIQDLMEPVYDGNRCEICAAPIEANGKSTDLIVTTTTYDGNKDPVKTMESVPEGLDLDYVVVCQECTPGVVEAWNDMLYLLRSKGA